MITAIAMCIAIAADEAYCLDLRSAADLNPYNADAIAAGPGFAVPLQFKWLEAEAALTMSAGVSVEELNGASGGKAIGGGFGASADDAIEYAFDLPWSAKEAYVYIRTARKSENALVKLQVFVNGDARGTALVPTNKGYGDDPQHFADGLCSTNIGAIEMGRQVLRIQPVQGDEPVVIDGFWVSASPLSITGKLLDDGTAQPPLPPGTIVYRPGLNHVRGKPYDLIDPFENSGKAIVDARAGVTSIPVDGGQMSKIFVLATSPGAGAQGTLIVSYSDGRKEEVPVSFGPLHDKRSLTAAISLGSNRYAYLAEADLQGGKVNKLEIETEQRILILAVSFQP